MILVTAATPYEARPLARGLGLVKAGGPLYRGAVGGAEITLLETGMGPKRTAAALRSAASRGGELPSMIVSSGLAGALRPEIRSGDIIADLRECPPALVKIAREISEQSAVALRLGAVISAARVLTRPAEKARLGRKRRAAAVDMESETIRAWARGRGADFAVIRSVLDGVAESLPADVPESTAVIDLLRYGIRHMPRLPRLLRLGRAKGRCLRQLAVFLKMLLPKIGSMERNGHEA